MALTNADIEKLFQTANVRITKNPSLRDPQKEGHAAAVAFFEKAALVLSNRSRSAAARPAFS